MERLAEASRQTLESLNINGCRCCLMLEFWQEFPRLHTLNIDSCDCESLTVSSFQITHTCARQSDPHNALADLKAVDLSGMQNLVSCWSLMILSKQ